MRHSVLKACRLLGFSSAAAMALQSFMASALPSGGQVSAGQAAITTSNGQLTVNQTSSRAIINWNSFNVGQNEKVQFNDPNAQAITLNRIGSSGASAINGLLTSNGNVWILNPNGVLFGKNAQVNVGGLLASTSGITNLDFMAGKYRFTPGSNAAGTVVNEGTITLANAGLAALVAPSVINSGTITSRLGRVELASGNGFTLDLYGDGLINLAASTAVIAQLAANHGTINADGGTVTLTAAAANNVVNSLINMDGLIEANTVNGHAGSVSLKGSDETEVTGTIEAEGGQVETSGHSLSVSGTVVAKNWLLDPNNITIQSSGSDTNVSGNPNFTTSDDSAIVTTGSIQTALNNGTSVSIVTGNAGSNSEAGDIEVASNIIKTGGGDASLTLEAYHNITVDSGVQIASTTGKLNVTLDANDTGAASGGAILMNSGSGIASNGGDIILGGGTNPLTGNTMANASGAGLRNGVALEQTSLEADGGDITINGLVENTNPNNGLAGVYIYDSTIATTGNANIAITGTGGSYTSPGSWGIFETGSTIQTSAGSINLSGTGGAGPGSTGIELDGGQLSSLTGNVTLNGIGGTASDGTSVGILQDGGLISSANGNISVMGTGGNSPLQSVGILLAQGTVDSTGTNYSAVISLNGQAGDNVTGYGIELENELISSIESDITLTGHGGNNAAASSGIFATENSGNTRIESTGMGMNAANITLNGTGGTGVGTGGLFGGNTGMTLISTDISSVDGGITLTGQGGGTGSGDMGIALGGGAQITRTGTGIAAITLNGTGSAGAPGIEAAANGTVPNRLTAAAGNILLNTDSLNTVYSLDTPPLTANVDISTPGALILSPLTTSMSIVTDSQDNALIGNETGDIEIAGNVDQSLSRNTSLTFAAYHNIIVDPGVQIGASGTGKMNVTLDADGYGGGAIVMGAGSGINSNGGNIILGGGVNPLSDSAQGNATYNNGILLSDASLNAGGGNIIMNGTGYSSSSEISSGIYANSSSIQTSGSGGIVMYGAGGSSTYWNGDENDGISFSYSTLSAQNGSISLIGYAGSRGSGLPGVNGIADTGISAYISTIRTTGNGNIAMMGIGGNGDASLNAGIYNNNIIQAEGNGGISLNGTGGTGNGVGNIADNMGIYNSGTIATSGSGNLAITGTGGGGAYSNDAADNTGIANLTGGGIIETTGTGEVMLTGTGGSGTGAVNQGIDNEYTIRTTGGGNLILTGNGGVGNGADNTGIYNSGMFTDSIIETTAGGNITLAGFGGLGNQAHNGGIENNNNSIIETAGGGNITLMGTGGSEPGLDYGVENAWGTILTTGSGGITITGIAGSNADNAGIGFQNYDGTIGGMGMSGNITLIADSIAQQGNSSITTRGNITITPYTAGTSVGIGSGVGALSIDDAMLGSLTYGSLTLGGVHTGAMDIASGATFINPVVFQTGRNITLDSALTSTASGTSFTFATGSGFLNTDGANALMPGTGGRFLVYAPLLSDNHFNGLNFDFTLYGCRYGAACPPLPATGDGLVYSGLFGDTTGSLSLADLRTVQQTIVALTKPDMNVVTGDFAHSFTNDGLPPAPIFIDASLLQDLGLNANDPHGHGWWNGVVPVSQTVP